MPRQAPPPLGVADVGDDEPLEAPFATEASSGEPEAEPSSPEQERAIEERRTDLRYSGLRAQLEREPLDRRWAAEAATAIDVAATDSSLSGSRIVDVECRQTLCAISAEHDDWNAAMAFGEVFFLHLSFLPRATARRVVQPDGTVRTIAYAARSGHPLLTYSDLGVR